MKKIIKLVLFLGIVSAVSGLLLGYVNSITELIIEKTKAEAEKANLELMYPGSEFEKIADNLVDGETILAIYEVKDKGYVFKLWGKGYGSNGITILAGFNYDGSIYKVISLEQQETSGFGSRVFEQLDELYAGNALDEDVDMLAGATVTSTAMSKMLNDAKIAFKGLH